MTPLESKLLQTLGLAYLRILEQLAILIFFYGASLLVPVYGSFTSLMTGLFFVLFSASVVIFVFVFSFLQAACFWLRPDPSGGEDFLPARRRPCS